jgi:CRISPR-associated protein Csy2
MNGVYLLIPRLRVQGANAQAAWWLINSAPVMACTMFGHALGRHLGKPATGVAIIHHAAQLHGEYFYGRLRPEQRRGAVFINKDDYSSKNKYALSLQPTASFSGEFSLIIEFEEMAEIDLAKVREFLFKARLAGGQIIKHDECELIKPGDRDKWEKRIRPGFWLIDRRDLMQKTEGEDWLDVLLRITARPERRKTEAASPAPASDAESEIADDEDAGDWLDRPPVRASLPSAWLIATTLGYALLTPTATRAGVREGYPHAFAEPLVGPAQYVSFYRFGDRALPIWRPHWPRDDVFLLSQSDLEM